MPPLMQLVRDLRGRRGMLIITAFIAFAVLLLSFTHSTFPSQYISSQSSDAGRRGTLAALGIKKPQDIPVVGFVFFGRKSRVEILRCYIERNLVDNGGWLDEVQWVRNTENEEDLAYLDELVASSPRYKTVNLTQEDVEADVFNHAWAHMERGKLYVKIDDDVVWMADDTIPRMVDMKIKHPEYFMVSANVINSPLMGWVHYHVGSVHPYLPDYQEVTQLHAAENNELAEDYSNKLWKYTSYPPWDGPDDFNYTLDQNPPFKGHRWLRLQNNSAMAIQRTPVREIEYKTWGTGLNSWAIVAQEHYSFLENLLNDQLDLYRLGRVWLANYDRLSINLMVLSADEVLDNLPMDVVDEEWLTVRLPQRLGKSVAIDTEALATHFSFSFQEGGVIQTDLLPRYKDYADSNVCHH